MKTYLIRHVKSESVVSGASYWYRLAFDSQDEAVEAVRRANQDHIFLQYLEIEDALAKITEMTESEIGSDLMKFGPIEGALSDFVEAVRERAHDDPSPSWHEIWTSSGGSEIWEEGERSFEFGDFREIIEDFDLPEGITPTDLLEYVDEHPTANAENVRWAIENGVIEEKEEEEE